MRQQGQNGFMRNTLLPLVLLAQAGFVLRPAQAGTVPPCAQESAVPAVVSDVSGRSELRLDDGRLIRLAGLELLAAADGQRAAAVAAEIAAWLKGRPVLLRPLAQKPDRWGRIAVQAFGPLPPGAEAGAPAALPYINEALAAAGLLRVQPGAEANDCLARLYEAEAQSREAGFGIWADAAFAPVDAADTEALAGRSGQFTLVQGQVRRVGQGRLRTYLDFGQGRGDFSLTVQKRLALRFSRAGKPLEGLAGQFLRARGIVDTRFGPQIEISGPEEIEFIDGSVEKALTKPVDKDGGR